MSEETIKQDLEKHPELSPILDSDKDGNIVCLGWITPILTWDDLPRMVKELEGDK